MPNRDMNVLLCCNPERPRSVSLPVSVLFTRPGLHPFCSGGRDHLIRVWDVETLVCRRTLAGHTDDVLSLGGVSVSVSGSDLGALVSPGSPTMAALAAGLSPLGGPLAPPMPGSPGGGGMPGSPRAGLERALLFVSAGADGTVRLWSGVQPRSQLLSDHAVVPRV
jgi:WD40 repeat protein